MPVELEYILSKIPEQILPFLNTKYSKRYERYGDHEVISLYYQTSSMSEYNSFKETVKDYKEIIYSHNNKSILLELNKKLCIFPGQEVKNIIIGSPYGHTIYGSWEDINILSYDSIVGLLRSKGEIFTYDRAPALNLRIGDLSFLFHDKKPKYKTL